MIERGDTSQSAAALRGLRSAFETTVAALNVTYGPTTDRRTSLRRVEHLLTDADRCAVGEDDQTGA
jgi:hypothetical protein